LKNRKAAVSSAAREAAVAVNVSALLLKMYRFAFVKVGQKFYEFTFT
jgi:hypothetical protein